MRMAARTELRSFGVGKLRAGAGAVCRGAAAARWTVATARRVSHRALPAARRGLAARRADAQRSRLHDSCRAIARGRPRSE